MDPSATRAQTASPPGRQTAGRWAALARGTWVLATLGTVALFAASLPTFYDYLRTICTAARCADVQLTPPRAQAYTSVGMSPDAYAAYFTAVTVVFAATYLAAALLIFRWRSREPVALLGALFLVTFGLGTFPDPLDILAHVHPVWSFPVACIRFLGSASLALFFYVFPDGRFVPRWVRWPLLAGLILQVPDTFFPDAALSSSHLFPLLTFVTFLVVLGPLVFSQVYRYRRVSNTVERLRTKWVVYGLALALGGFLVLILVSALVPEPQRQNPVGQLLVLSTYYLVLLALPASFAVAILRHRLWDIDVLINRTLVYSALTACVVGLYVLVVGYLGALFRTGSNPGASLIATGLIAVLFQPLRERLQRGVNRLLYGRRDEPYAVVSRLSRRLGATLAPDAILPTIVETVAEALKLPFAAIAVQHDGALTTAAARGTPAGEVLKLSLVYQGESVGELLLAPRQPGESFSPADRRLLEDLARQAGIAVHAARLTADLQRSRERLVAAREEERRRLRRDLHDGLGPALGGLTLQMDTVNDLIERDPAAARELVARLKFQAQEAIADVRRLVYDLRPPALDELGLATALREQAARYNQLDGLRVAVGAPDAVPPLPAAVEVAAYRIALEALANVARHAQARSCRIHLDIAGALTLDVTDDGRGLPASFRAGVGLTSIRERAAELGGTCVIAAPPGGGTRVHVELPLPRE